MGCFPIKLLPLIQTNTMPLQTFSYFLLKLFCFIQRVAIIERQAFLFPHKGEMRHQLNIYVRCWIVIFIKSRDIANRYLPVIDVVYFGVNHFCFFYLLSIVHCKFLTIAGDFIYTNHHSMTRVVNIPIINANITAKCISIILTLQNALSEV